METLTPIKKIDAVLEYLKSNKNKISFEALLDEMKKRGVVEVQAHLRTIIDKLEYDRFVIDVTVKGMEVEQLLISHEGLLFKGYQATLSEEIAALELSAAEKAHFGQVEQQGIDNGQTLNKLTKDLGKATWFAGAAAVALFLWDVVKF